MDASSEEYDMKKYIDFYCMDFRMTLWPMYGQLLHMTNNRIKSKICFFSRSYIFGGVLRKNCETRQRRTAASSFVESTWDEVRVELGVSAGNRSHKNLETGSVQAKGADNHVDVNYMQCVVDYYLFELCNHVMCACAV